MSLRNTRHEDAALSSQLPISPIDCTFDPGATARVVPIAPGGGSHEEMAAAGREIKVPQEQGRGTEWVAKYPVSTWVHVQLGHYNATKE